MPKERDLELAELGSFGASVVAEKMTNEENRIRIAFADGSGRIVVVWSETGGWQDSATMVRDDSKPVMGEEYVIVQKGWVAIATQSRSGGVQISVYPQGSKFYIDPNQVHNTYLAPNSRVVAVISGDWSGVSRRPDPAFDGMTQHLDGDIIRMSAQ